MKTFTEWLDENQRRYDCDNEVSDYLKYAFGEVQKQLHPLMSYDPSMISHSECLRKQKESFESGVYTGQLNQQGIDGRKLDAARANWDKGYQEGKEAGKKISSGYGSLKLGERAVNCDEYDRLQRSDRKARDAYYNGVYEGKCRQRSRHAKELAAARECAMTFISRESSALNAILILRIVLDISIDDVIRKHNEKY